MTGETYKGGGDDKKRVCRKTHKNPPQIVFVVGVG